MSLVMILTGLGAVGAGPDQVTFQGIGFLPGGRAESAAIAVSADGRVVTGWSASPEGIVAVRWTDGKLERLGGPGLSTRVGHALSADGSVVVGVAQTDGQSVAFRWENGQTAVLPFPEAGCESSEAWGVSGDGRTIAGSVVSPGRTRAVVWRNGEASFLLDPRGGRPSSAAIAISSDGTTIVGYFESEAGREAVAWRGDSMFPLGVPTGGSGHGEGRAVSSDGAFIVGSGSTIHGLEAFRWNDGRLTVLGGFSREHESLFVARGVAEGGAVVVGHAVDDRDTPQAVVWDEVNGSRSLQRILATDLKVALDGWFVDAATSISADGRTIVGSGRNPQGAIEGWVVRLPGPWWKDDLVRFRGETGRLGHRMNERAQPRLGRGLRELNAVGAPRDVTTDLFGTMYVVDSLGKTIHRFRPSGEMLSTWGPSGGLIDLEDPAAMVVSDEGTGFVVDSGRSRIRVIGFDGQVLDTWGEKGSSPGRFIQPRGIAVDQGLIYVADTGNDRIQVLDVRGSFLREFGRFGHGEGELNHPIDLCVGEDRVVHVADGGNHRVCTFEREGAWIRCWGARGSTPGLFLRPAGIECAGGLVYVVDQLNHRVQVFSTDGALQYVWGRQTLRPLEAGGRISDPERMSISSDQSYAVLCEPVEDRCQVFDMVKGTWGVGDTPSSLLDGNPYSGVVRALHVAGDMMVATDDAAGFIAVHRMNNDGIVMLTKVGTPGNGPGQLSDPLGIWFDQENAQLFVADSGNHRVHRFDLMLGDRSSTTFAPNLARLRKTVDTLGLANPGSKDRVASWRPGRLEGGPRGLAVVDESNECVVLLDRGLTGVRTLGGPGGSLRDMGRPVDVAFDGTGDLVFVLYTTKPGVAVYQWEGSRIRSWGMEGSEPGALRMPGGIAVDQRGFVYVSDEALDRVQKFDERGNLVAPWGTRGVGPGEFVKPGDLALDSQGRVYVNDRGNRRVQVFTPEGRFLRAFGSPMTIHPTLIRNPNE